jgi:hypothetical protein
MPASSSLVLSAPPVDSDVCRECSGTGIDRDRDGSVTGRLGTLIPCSCADDQLGDSPRCGCHLPWWPYNNGLTGLVRKPLEEYGDDSPFLLPCPQHAANLVIVAVAGEVAA